MRPDAERIRRLLTAIIEAEKEWRAIWSEGGPPIGTTTQLVTSGLHDAKSGLQQFVTD